MQLPLPTGKYRNRIGTVLLHAVSQLLPSIANLLLSVLIVRLFAPQWWGQIAALQLYQYLAVQVVAWGNKDVLLRSFSTDPAALPRLFAASFSGRWWLLMPIVLLTFFFQDDPIIFTHLTVWICCRFVQQSVEAPALFQRQFNAIIFSEIAALVVMIGVLFLLKDPSFNIILCVVSIGQLLRTTIQVASFRTLFSRLSIDIPDLSFFVSSFPFMLLGLLAILQQKTDLLVVIKYTNDVEVARYQVFTTFYLLALSIPMLIAGPFVKNVYRISMSTLGKVQLVFALSGALLNLFIMLAAFLVLEYMYLFHFDTNMYMLAWVSATATYLFSLTVIRLYKSNRQWLVLGVNASAVLLNAVLSVLLLPRLGLTGALIANVSGQLLLLVLFRLVAPATEAVN
jgi:O-antigen/teichoic acid export membrane protein